MCSQALHRCFAIRHKHSYLRRNCLPFRTHCQKPDLLPGSRGRTCIVLLSALALIVAAVGVRSSYAQEENTRGKVAGTVRNAGGAPIPGAKVQVISRVRDTHYDLTTDGRGRFESPWLQEAQYTVRIEARNFLVELFVVDVKIGQTAKADRILQPINPGAPVLESSVDPGRIGNLPIDGRDALNSAKFEPEVAIQDGGRLDATKSGNFAASIDKISGLDSRYTLDGVDISDETKGGITENIALGSVQELMVTRSMRNTSTGLSSSGTVQMTTRSGGDGYHGEAYGLVRDSGVGFAPAVGGQDPKYSRYDAGGRFGGALIKDKLFFFVAGEHVQQDLRQPVVVPAPFQALIGGYSSPFRNTSASGRLDFKLSDNLHAFYRFAYNLNSSIDNFGDSYSLYDNRSHAPSHAVGLDYAHGEDTHSIRFGYLRYSNSLGTAGALATVPSVPGINLRFSDLAGGAVQFGPSPFGPQQTRQSNLEFRYDGSRTHGNHVIHFGGSVNRIQAGGFAIPYGFAPQVTTRLGTGIDPNILDYSVLGATLSNGQGFATEHSGLGFPRGGLTDTRLQAYVGGAWRLRPNLTVTWGAHYVRDSGRTDSDLGAIPCSAIVASLPAGTAPCSGSAKLLDQFGFVAGLGAAVRQPNLNFGPQAGFAWDPGRNGRTIIRGGAGVFYDNSLFSNVRNDRPARLSSGLFSGTNALSCAPGAAAGTVAVNFPTPGGTPNPVTSIDGLDLATQVCGQPVGGVTTAIADLQSAYAAAVAATGANPDFVGRTLAINTPISGLAGFESTYRTPRSYQGSLGLQREAWRGGMITLDFVRNVSQRFGLIQDNNHVGDWNYINTNAALAAVTRTVSQKAPSCLPGVPLSAGAIVENAVSCYISAVPGASINDFAVNGLDSGVAYLGGLPSSVARGVGPDLGAAFPGQNALVGQGMFMTSEGQAVYNGGQVAIRQTLDRTFSAFRSESFQISYSLSKFVSSGGDDFSGSSVAYDFRSGARYKGPSPLDRRHQVAFAGMLESRWGPRLLFAGRIASPAPTVLTMAVPSDNPQATPGEIFRTDFTGDGTPGDIFPPKLKAGSFNPPSGGSLYSAISKYNNRQAGALTPAGSALVTAKIMTQSQLATLRGVQPFVVLPPTNEVANPWFKSFDTALTWPLRVRESLLIEPRVSFYNVFNIANFAPLSGQLTYYFPGLGQPQSGGAGSANGTPRGAARDVLRTGFGSGVYNAGAPRQMEFGVRITF